MITQLRKFLLVAAIVLLFALYAIQERPQSIAVDSKTLAALQTSMPIVRPASPTAAPSLTPATISAALPSPTGANVSATASTAQSTATTPPATATNTPQPTALPTQTPSGRYIDGTYTGSEEDAHWGYVTVQVTVTNGMVTDVQFLEYPNHRNRSVEINDYAMPVLIEEAIQAQSADVDLVSGATDISRAFVYSLDTALQQALA